MNNGKIIWWIILIVIGVIIVWQFYWTDESENKCCTISDPIGMADGLSMTYCKRNGKYYSSGTGGIAGKIPESEITEQQFNSAWQNGDCKKQ